MQNPKAQLILRNGQFTTLDRQHPQAMIACVKRIGLSFIVDNLNHIRYELIYYVLLKVDTNFAELRKSKKAILSEDEHPMWGMMEFEHVIKLIDQVAY